MAINRLEVKDFLVFKGEFAVDFGPGVNVIIGGNATGKTTLLKIMYALRNFITNYMLANERYYPSEGSLHGIDLNEYFLTDNKMPNEFRIKLNHNSTITGNQGDEFEAHFGNNITMCFDIYARFNVDGKLIGNYGLFIPEKDILSHSKGFLALNNKREISFDKTYVDILTNAELGQARELSALSKSALGQIAKVIGGDVVYENDTFYIVKSGKSKASKVPFSAEASGYRKFGLLWKLLRNGLLEVGSVLFWDEPENSINPELLPVLVDILLELQRGGVQIFLATHSEILASYFDVNRKDDDKVMFYSLYKDRKRIKADKSDKFSLLTPNNLTAEQVKLYEREVERGLG